MILEDNDICGLAAMAAHLIERRGPGDSARG